MDHFQFLNRTTKPEATATASRTAAAEIAEWFLSTSDRWVAPYFDPNSLRSVDRQLFA